MPVIRVEQLVKKFDELTAVDDVSFSISEGEIFGFLGPNGAGKTTILSILSTLLQPTSGIAEVNGFEVTSNQNEVRRSIGMVFQDPTLDEELTARENMYLHGRLYGMKKPGEKIDHLLELVELMNWKNKQVKYFSGGMKRRLEIARGLLHEPKILFLDEPTLGLDPQTRNHLWDYIQHLNREKKVTIILTTHYMEEADKLSNRVGIIDNGKVIAMNTPFKLKEELGGSMILIESYEGEKVKNTLSGMDVIDQIYLNNGVVHITLQQAEKNIVKIIQQLQHVAIESVALRKPGLEEVFLNYTGKSMREEEASTKESIRQRTKIRRRR